MHDEIVVPFSVVAIIFIMIFIGLCPGCVQPGAVNPTIPQGAVQVPVQPGAVSNLLSPEAAAKLKDVIKAEIQADIDLKIGNIKAEVSAIKTQQDTLGAGATQAKTNTNANPVVKAVGIELDGLTVAIVVSIVVVVIGGLWYLQHKNGVKAKGMEELSRFLVHRVDETRALDDITLGLPINLSRSFNDIMRKEGIGSVKR